MSQLAAETMLIPPRWPANSNPLDLGLPITAIDDCASALSMAEVVGVRVPAWYAERRSFPIRSMGERRRKMACPCPMWKRAMDVAGAGVLLAILSPLFFAIAIYIKCVSRGPVLFRQKRYGVNGRPFKVWKFRTIEVGEAPVQHRSHVNELMSNDRTLAKCDHRLDVIPGGALLRRLGLDELPQLMNVILGEMSLVGPRPDVVPYQDYGQWHRRRFEVLPGITGLWQVNGKNRTTFSTMMKLDAIYVRRRSFLLDVVILLRTIPAIVLD